MKHYINYMFLFFCLQFTSCAQQKKQKDSPLQTEDNVLKIGADRTDLYLTKLKHKNIAIVANQTSTINTSQRAEVSKNTMGLKETTQHLVDYLHNHNSINVKKVFAPEHGFRGKADAGEVIVDGMDTKTNLPIISLYGKNKKPSSEQLKNIDFVVFDIQDVGVRFYTYISTLHYVMEACAESNIPIIVLDRPNPNAHYIDGPVLEIAHKSFVGMHPVPVVYGMTIGEYGKMINGEKWLKNGIQCNLIVIPLENYSHDKKYSLPTKPSPNLPNDTSINLYPSLCFFEGTNVSVGRGTNKQFQIYGSPYLQNLNFKFTPQPNEGAKYPKHKEKLCFGESLEQTDFLSSLQFEWLLKAFKQTTQKEKFFNSFFTKLAGTEKLQKQIENGYSKQQIKDSWKKELNEFRKIRTKYLIYN